MRHTMSTLNFVATTCDNRSHWCPEHAMYTTGVVAEGARGTSASSLKLGTGLIEYATGATDNVVSGTLPD